MSLYRINKLLYNIHCLMKVYLNKINESWVVDRFREEWENFNSDISTSKIKEADIVWIFTPWMWNNIKKRHLKNKKVLCSIYHIDFNKFDDNDIKEFHNRDQYVDVYHVISIKTKEQLEKLTDKKIVSIPFWVNQNIWFQIEEKEYLRKKYNLNEDKFLVGSFQRDTEGSDLTSPKLIKGPDQFIEIVKNLYLENNEIEIVLTGKRRQYIMKELDDAGIKYNYYEMASFDELNELYNLLDLYIVSSRIEGGPQAIMECAITKTPIISTDVGIASEILSKESIYNMNNFINAKPNIEFAFKQSKDYTIPKGFEKYRTLLTEVYES